MATESYPVDGENGFTIGDWADYNGSRDGLDGCYDADNLSLTRIDASNICRIGSGSMSINGYRLRVPTGDTLDLTCPAPTSGTVVYYIVGYYDPLLNVENADHSAPRPLGACRIGLYSITDIATAMQGKAYVLLYTITRAAGQALSAATVTSSRRWLGGPVIEWPASVPNPPVGDYLVPRGTLRVQPDVHKLLLRTPNAQGVLDWLDILNQGPFAFPAPSSLVANSGPPQYFIHSGVMVKCRGTLKRSSGTLSSGSNDVTLGTFPVGFRPAFIERYLCKTGAGKGYIEVRVGPDGLVIMTGETGVDWIDLSSITFRAEL